YTMWIVWTRSLPAKSGSAWGSSNPRIPNARGRGSGESGSPVNAQSLSDRGSPAPKTSEQSSHCNVLAGGGAAERPGHGPGATGGGGGGGGAIASSPRTDAESQLEMTGRTLEAGADPCLGVLVLVGVNVLVPVGVFVDVLVTVEVNVGVFVGVNV